MNHSAVRALATLGAALLLALAACSSKNKADKPAELVDIKQTLKVQRAWSAGLGGELKLRLGLGAAVDGEVVYFAGAKGDVQAVALATGKTLWRRNVRASLAGGPGVGNGMVVVGTQEGEVFALATADGAPRWQSKVASEILAAPAVGGEVVVVRTVDGKLHGLAASSGTQIWVTDQQLPRLTLRGNAPPVVSGDAVLAGFDNGRLLAVSLQSGTTLWETGVAQARGSSELQRLIDIDAPLAIDGNDLFSVAYQGRVARIARETGVVVWARDLSSNRGLAIDDESIYVSTSEGEVVRLERSTGSEVWRQKALLRRQLSAPAIYNGHVVVADLDGVIHFLNPADGAFVARAEAGARVSAPPVVAGGLLLFYDDDGGLRAFRTPAG